MTQTRLSPLQSHSSSPSCFFKSPTQPTVTPYKPSIEDVLWDFNLCMSESTNCEIHVFSEVSIQDFQALANIVEKWSFLEGKPKLSHHPMSGLLIVEMTTPVHQFAITDFSRAVQPALDSLPINPHRLRIALEPNLLLRSTLTGFQATPNLALVSTSIGDRLSDLSMDVFAVVECAFSQDRGNLMKKIRNEVEGWPEIALVVAVFVSEARDYKSPPIGSPTWNYFAQHESVLSPNCFLSLPPSIDGSAASTPVDSECTSPSDTANRSHSAVSDGSDSDSNDELEPLVLNPITIAEHTWCDIREVQYHIWVEEDGILDLDGPAGGSTIGYLYPNIEMEDVEQAINSGLSIVKSKIAQVAAKTTKSRSALHKLQEAELSVQFDWRAIQSAVKMAAAQIATSRYEAWFSNLKRSHPDDESHHPSESQSSSSVASLGSPNPAQPRYMLHRRI